ncbi:MAG: precorrin-8X methylmutase [Firmicutes bacterium]|nr:precorrin-8X methylmutase [Bacillota bacterium]
MTDYNFILKPVEIENKSFEIISQLLEGRSIEPLHEPIIKRVIHTTADLDYVDILKFSENAVEKGLQALKSGCGIVTDTKMAEAGINKKALTRLGAHITCFMDDEEVAKEAVQRGTTRAAVSMEKASTNSKNKIFVIGNAPTALIRLYDMIRDGVTKPELVIGVPVGFVNVVESKQLFKQCDVPFIISEGRKGGSNVAVAIVNSLMYMALKEEDNNE